MSVDAKQFLEQHMQYAMNARIYKSEAEWSESRADEYKKFLPSSKVPRERMMQRCEEYRREYNHAIRCAKAIESMIERVDGLRGEVLRARYIELRKWGDIATSNGYTTRRAQQIHDEALEQLQGLLDAKQTASRT